MSGLDKGKLPIGIWTITSDGKRIIKTFKPASACSPGELMGVDFAKARGTWRRNMMVLEQQLENYEQEQKLDTHRTPNPKED